MMFLRFSFTLLLFFALEVSASRSDYGIAWFKGDIERVKNSVKGPSQELVTKFEKLFGEEPFYNLLLYLHCPEALAALKKIGGKPHDYQTLKSDVFEEDAKNYWGRLKTVPEVNGNKEAIDQVFTILELFNNVCTDNAQDVQDCKRDKLIADLLSVLLTAVTKCDTSKLDAEEKALLQKFIDEFDPAKQKTKTTDEDKGTKQGGEGNSTKDGSDDSIGGGKIALIGVSVVVFLIVIGFVVYKEKFSS